MATHNYLGFAGNVEIEKAAVETIRKYGVGSCGPRGFYGTVGKLYELIQVLPPLYKVYNIHEIYLKLYGK